MKPARVKSRSRPRSDRRRKRGRARWGRLLARIQAYPTIAVLVLICSLLPVFSAARWSVSLLQAQLFWRAQAEQQLDSLYVGMSIDTLRETFGAPVVTDVAGEGLGGPLDESVFEGHDGDFYVQALTDRSGSVERFVVTSCTDGFRPTVGPAGLDVTLYEDMLATGSTVDKNAVIY